MRSFIICSVTPSKDIRQRRVTWQHKEKNNNAYRVLVGKPDRKGRVGIPSLKCRIILKLILTQYDANVWNGLLWLRTGTSGGLLSDG